MNVLVTGGAGFIGSHIVDAFRSRNHRVAVLDNLSTGSRDHLRDDVVFFEADIRDKGAVVGAFQAEPPDIVVHLAAQADVRKSMDDPAYDATVNLIGTLHLLEAARRYGARRFVFASTGGAVYGEPEILPANEDTLPAPLSCYGASKHAVEDYLRIYREVHGLPTTVLRFANVYGPRQNPKGEAGVVAIFSLLMLEGKQPTIFGDGAKTRDYVFVEDVVRANLLAAERGIDGTFNIGTGRRTSDQEVFAAVRDAVGTDIEPLYALRRKGEVEHIVLDATRAATGLGWKSEVEFEEGVRRSVAWYREHAARG